MSMAPREGPSSSPTEPRVIKRYANRKLYDTKESRYVTLLQIAEMIRADETVQIIDSATKDDKTDLTFALIISEELKARPHGIPIATLKALIRQSSERIIEHLRDSPIRRLILRDQAEEPVAADAAPVLEEKDDLSGGGPQQKGLRATLQQWQAAIDERLSAVLPESSTVRELRAELKRLSDRLAEMEERLGESTSE